jgi:hypothetical protein
MDLNHGDVEQRMSHYPPASDVTIGAHELARELAKAHAKALMDLLPPGREKSLVLTALEEALMWANAAIARNRGPAQHVSEETLVDIRAAFGADYGVGVGL